MGQSVCGQQSDLKSSSNNPSRELDLEVPHEEGGDNPMRQKFQNSFLQTSVIASWNILKQKPQEIINMQCLISSFSANRNSSNNNVKNPNQQANLPFKDCNKENAGENNKKYRVQVEASYENIEIDISGFVKVRNENIYEHYEFKQKVGEGSFGNVYRGVQKKSGQVRAIKALKKNKMNVSSKMSFAAEIELLKKLDHPNIIKLYDLFLFDGNYYVVTQFCEGGSLQDYYSIKGKALNQSTVKIIMKQLISTLAYLYNQSIVHRDLKLENIVFLNSPQSANQNLSIKLIDFGTAIKVSKNKKNPTGLVGTLLYIAPEFTKGFYTQKCDIWSAGVIFYQLLFQDFPFKGRSEKEILNQILTKNLDWNSLGKKFKVHKTALEMVQGMLDKNYISRLSVKCLIKNGWFEGISMGTATNEIRSTVTKNLANYSKKNNFVSIMQSFLTFKKTSQQERQQLSKMFFEIDKDQSGIIQTQELMEFYRKNFPEIEDKEVMDVVNNVDKNKSGKIDFNEFLTAVRRKNQLYAEQSLREAFDFVDKDKTNNISKKELKLLLRTAQKKEIQELFRNLDSNNDNQISFQQFKNYLLNY